MTLLFSLHFEVDLYLSLLSLKRYLKITTAISLFSSHVYFYFLLFSTLIIIRWHNPSWFAIFHSDSERRGWVYHNLGLSVMWGENYMLFFNIENWCKFILEPFSLNQSICIFYFHSEWFRPFLVFLKIYLADQSLMPLFVYNVSSPT